MAEFCKQFNEKTKNFVKDVPIPVVLDGNFFTYCHRYVYILINLHVYIYISIYVAFSNRTFTFKCKTPETSWLLKKCAGVEKGAKR